MKKFLITNEELKAKLAVANGVDYIFVDMETLGKEERQSGRGAVFNKHNINDVKNITSCVPQQNSLIRVNPINPNSEKEIQDVLAFKPGHIMLPFFKEKEELELFSKLTKNKTSRYLLVETIEALELLPRAQSLDLYDKLHLGLNDLSIEMGYKCIFKVLFDERFLAAVSFLNSQSIPFGIGGAGKLDGDHQIPAEMLLTHYTHLGSQAVILSRAFNTPEIWTDVDQGIKKELTFFDAFIKNLNCLSNSDFKKNEENLQSLLENFS